MDSIICCEPRLIKRRSLVQIGFPSPFSCVDMLKKKIACFKNTYKRKLLKLFKVLLGNFLLAFQLINYIDYIAFQLINCIYIKKNCWNWLIYIYLIFCPSGSRSSTFHIAHDSQRFVGPCPFFISHIFCIYIFFNASNLYHNI